MSTVHLGATSELKAIDVQISQLKAICKLTGDDAHIFNSLHVPLNFAADSPEARACQRLKGLYFLRSFVGYERLRTLQDSGGHATLPPLGF